MNFNSYTFRWAVTFLLCIKLFHGAWGNCPAPPNIQNTNPVSVTSGASGDTVVYTCNRNTGYYEIPGKSTTITCQGDGTWTNLEEFCARACGVPPRLDYAMLEDSALNQDIFLPNATVTYTCRPGYVRSAGSRTLTCLEDYTWSTPPVPFCNRRSCGNPGEIINGEMHAEDFLFGSRVTYKCNEGFHMTSRRNYRDCQTDGTWSNAPPDCEAAICQAPTATSGLTIEPLKDEYSYLEVVKFSCQKPLEVVGNDSAFCTTEGIWSSDVPTCKAVNCIDPEVPNSRRLSGFVGPYKLNSAISFECKEGFVLKGESTITCNINSEWVPQVPVCKIASCEDLGLLQNGQITYPNGFSVGKKAIYTCNKGYALLPPVKERTCQENEMWSGSAPSCEAISCGPLEKIQNGHVNVSGVLYGSTAKYTCEEGYVRNTTREHRECQADGKWSEAISCIEEKEKPSGLGVGAIVGIVIGVICLLIIIIVVYRVCKEKQRKGKPEPKVEYSHCNA